MICARENEMAWTTITRLRTKAVRRTLCAADCEVRPAAPAGLQRPQARDADALQAWFASHPGGPIDYQIRDLMVAAGGDVAFCHSLNQLGGALWFRSTFGLRKISGQRLVTHEHNSTPFYMDGSDKAALDLQP
jgi:ketosteroid isomerase-like protein